MPKNNFAITIPGFGKITSRAQFYRKLLGKRNKKQNKLLIAIILIVILTIAWVILNYQTRKAEPAPDQYKLQTQALCDKYDGVWQKWGAKSIEYCQIPAIDADTPCTDGSECSYGSCFTVGNQIPGTCQRFHDTYGCVTAIRQGELGATTCTD